MVWARKYQLLIPSQRQKGVYSTEENSKKLIYQKLVPRSYVEDRNSHPNNELYEIDEEKTSQLMKERENNIIDNAEKAKLENVGMHDLIRAIGANQSTSPTITAKEVKKTPIETIVKDEVDEVESSMDDDLSGKTLLELQQICTNKKIRSHHKAKEPKLIELIKNA